MTRMKQVALLRAVNVGGSNIISMAKLINISDQLGSKNNKTILQSGNLVFENAQTVREEEFESELSQRLHINTDVMIRSAADWQNTINNNPFEDMAARDPSHLLVLFLKSEPSDDSILTLRAAATGPEEVHSHGKDLYVTYPDGIGRSKLTTKVVEKHLGIPCTGRNWNTILKINTLFHNEYSTKSSKTPNKMSTKVPSTVTERRTTSSALMEVEKVSRKRSRG